ncbi:MAG: haloacid dehalogenase-like hydrolase [Verrucomicrobiota bacterium]|nr:haloacid dehalogenase-like hydrolase [Verrucomicrobiota bacterium]
MPGKRLLLWDIDGTLISTGAAGQRAIARATAARFEGGDLDGVEIAGRTDLGIGRQILSKYGAPVNDTSIHSFLDLYLDLLAEEVPRGKGRVLPGVLELLEDAAKKPEITLGLLTGNLERGARLKLEHYGLWQFFAFGAFADDHHDRNELGAFALSRAWEKTGIDFAPAQIDVIGDTGHDIACGKTFRARTIAVATGPWSREQLAEHQPDFLFDDLANVDEVKKKLGW